MQREERDVRELGAHHQGQQQPLPVPLQLRLQIPGVKARVRDASLRRGPGKLARQEQITGFALPVVEPDASVFWASVIGQFYTGGPRRDEIYRRGAGPDDPDTAFRGGGGRFHEDGLKKSI